MLILLKIGLLITITKKITILSNDLHETIFNHINYIKSRAFTWSVHQGLMFWSQELVNILGRCLCRRLSRDRIH